MRAAGAIAGGPGGWAKQILLLESTWRLTARVRRRSIPLSFGSAVGARGGRSCALGLRLQPESSARSWAANRSLRVMAGEGNRRPSVPAYVKFPEAEQAKGDTTASGVRVSYRLVLSLGGSTTDDMTHRTLAFAGGRTIAW